MTALPFSKVIVIHGRLIRGAGQPLQKLIGFIDNNRYRYHENTIMNKGLLSQVGISDYFAASACSFHFCNNVNLLLKLHRDVMQAHPCFVSMILIATCSATYILTGKHVSLWQLVPERAW
jgi:hypothetical protein